MKPFFSSSSPRPVTGKPCGRFRRFAAALASVCVLTFSGCNAVSGGVFGMKGSGGVTANPPAATVARGGTKSFTAEIDGTADQRVLWSIPEAEEEGWNPGTRIITEGSGAGKLTVAWNETHESFTVRATAFSDADVFMDITVTVIEVFVTGVTVPPSAEVVPGGSRQFSVTVEGTGKVPQTVSWSIADSGVKPGTVIDRNGLLTVAADETLPVIRIMAASDVNENKFGVAQVTVPHTDDDTPARITGLTVTPVSATVEKGQSALFLADVTGEGNFDVSVVWDIKETGRDAGTVIADDGVLTVYRDELLDSLTVRATSIADPLISGEATVTLTAAESEIPEAEITGVTVSPAAADVAQGGTKRFTAAVTGTGVFDQSVVWTVEEAGKMPGTGINSGGSLSVARDEALTTLYVRATSVRDSSKYGRAEVTVTPFGSDGLVSAPFDSLAGDNRLTIILTGAKFADTPALSDFTLDTAGTPGFAFLEGGLITRTGDTVVTITGLVAATAGSGQKIIIAGTALADREDGASASVTASGGDGTPLYTVTLDMQSGAGGTESVQVTLGSLMPPITLPARTGYAFGGYWTEVNGGGTQYYTAVGINAQIWDIAGDTTLYAQWTLNTADPYTVTFDMQGGTGGTESVQVTLGNSMPDIVLLPERTGYAFGGYWTAQNGVGTQYYKADGTSARNWDIAGNITLYANWTGTGSCTVTLDYNYSRAPEPFTAIVRYGEKYGQVITGHQPERTGTGYTFAGWYTAASGGTRVTADTKVREVYDHFLYAHWTTKSYITVTYSSEYGYVVLEDGFADDMRVSYDGAYGTLLGKDAFSSSSIPAGKAFGGWWTEPEGGEQIFASTPVTQADDHEIYVHWTGIMEPEKQVTSIVFDQNARTLETGRSERYLPAVSPVNAGNKALRWSSGNPAVATVDTTGRVSTLQTGTTTITAAATDGSGVSGSYTLTVIVIVRFNTNGGPGSFPEQTAITGETYGTLPTTARTGCDFLGWFTAPKGGTKVTAETTVTQTASFTLYAHWLALKITVEPASIRLYNAWPLGSAEYETYPKLVYVAVLPDPPDAERPDVYSAWVHRNGKYGDWLAWIGVAGGSKDSDTYFPVKLRDNFQVYYGGDAILPFYVDFTTTIGSKATLYGEIWGTVDGRNRY